MADAAELRTGRRSKRPRSATPSDMGSDACESMARRGKVAEPRSASRFHSSRLLSRRPIRLAGANCSPTPRRVSINPIRLLFTRGPLLALSRTELLFAGDSFFSCAKTGRDERPNRSWKSAVAGKRCTVRFFSSGQLKQTGRWPIRRSGVDKRSGRVTAAINISRVPLIARPRAAAVADAECVHINLTRRRVGRRARFLPPLQPDTRLSALSGRSMARPAKSDRRAFCCARSTITARPSGPERAEILPSETLRASILRLNIAPDAPFMVRKLVTG